MKDAQAPITFYRSDYKHPNHRIVRTDLVFHLDTANTRVESRLEFQAWDSNVTATAPLELDGEDLELIAIMLNGQALEPTQYQLSSTGLVIPNAGVSGVLELVVTNKPDQNTRLEGLYVSNGNFFTQCEAQGFRRITYFPDRPDVLSRFTVTLIASKTTHPVTLSNGNLLDARDLADGLHLSRWEDPFPKPAYLFALVAGTFVCQEETITKSNGQPALLQVWVEPGNLDKTDFAMQSLKKSIEWDRQRFGLDLDLDRFMIVATGDFNMGAMENKGLNIFNTKFVFANPELATDVDFENVESVVGHEYFHNWTGNRVTCQDWFQLSLKEGLTVFRDQEFSADMQAHGLSPAQANSARAVKRIDDVKVLRAAQFPEDAGPMAHPIRPDSYQEINNFYTVTVYEKGAEVIRMQHTLLGEATFQRGMQIYFQRHDGQAATCEQFVAAMETALQEDDPSQNLQQFRHWYSQAGTPEVAATWTHDLTSGEFTLHLKQHCPATPGQPNKPVFHVPVRLGLLNQQGQDCPLTLKSPAGALRGDVLNFTEQSQTFVFTGLHQTVVPSLLRGFSAPVTMKTAHTAENLMFLARHDTDPFNRWDAGQQVYQRAILEIQANNGEVSGPATRAAVSVFGDLLADATLSDGYKALALQLPSEGTLFEAIDGLVDPLALHLARCNLRDLLACTHDSALSALYADKHQIGDYVYDTLAAGQRSLKNSVLAYLSCLDDDSALDCAKQQYNTANNMTDRMAALTALVHFGPTQTEVLQDYYQRFEKEALAIDKWFMVQASTPASNTEVAVLPLIQQLMKHPAFNWKNPNRVRSVLAALGMQNPSVFHSRDGSGYALWAQSVIKLNGINPQVAARMARALDRWTKLVPDLQTHARAALEQVLAANDLSPDVREVIGKALSAGNTQTP